LKTGIRITTVGRQCGAGDTGTPVFRQGERIYVWQVTDGPYTDAFEKWLPSDIGKRTIEILRQMAI
jgi:hypothetical protein